MVFERRAVDSEAGWLVLVGVPVTMGFGSKGRLEVMGVCKGRTGDGCGCGCASIYFIGDWTFGGVV